MAESVIVKQDSKFQTQFWTQENEESLKLIEVIDIHHLTPYGMMLTSLASCTAIVLHTYAQYHHIGLVEVEMRLRFDRNYKKDCENCETQQEYNEEIYEEIILRGTFSEDERQKLLHIAHACPIYKMYKNGIDIQTKLKD